MINFNKQSGFITLTIVVIIILLITILTWMTGRMLTSEQRSASNQIRYHEAKNAARYGMDLATIQLMTNVSNASAAILTTAIPSVASVTTPTAYYQASFGSQINVSAGASTFPVVPITAKGTSGYSANTSQAESTVTLNQEVAVIPVISATPASTLTVAAGMVAGGNFTIAANPNGGGNGVPVSIWSPVPVSIGASSNTCGLQEYYDGNCSSSPYSSTATGKQSDVYDTASTTSTPPQFPPDLLSYIFNGDTTLNQVLSDVRQIYPNTYATYIGSAGTGLPDCSSLGPTSPKGIYVVTGSCTIQTSVGSDSAPVLILVANADFKMNANAKVYGLVFLWADSSSASYKVEWNGGAILYGALVANYSVNVSAGTFAGVYDATALSNLVKLTPSIISTVPGSWHDW